MLVLALVAAPAGARAGAPFADLAAPGQGESPPGPSDVDPRFDPLTGRNGSVWPPDRPWDHEHVRIELDIADLESKTFRGVVELRARAVGTARASMMLDAGASLSVDSVRVNGLPARFAHADKRLVITLPTPAAPGEIATVRIIYAGSDPSEAGNGLVWLGTRSAPEADDARPPQMYSQGQAQWNHLWFPCHDFPHDKVTSEMVVTVPSGVEVISNGRLVSREPVAGGGASARGRTRWHWAQDRPHSTYLLSLAIGTFDVVELGGPASERPGLSMPVYGRPGSGESIREAFVNTPKMVRFLERYFDEPYPWDKYAQVLVRNFRWGGMENTSASTLSETAYSGFGGPGPTGIEALIVHELGHQWMGNLVTCSSWEHLWLNEGWATFVEWLWIEHEQGGEAYLDQVRQAVRQIAGASQARAPLGVALVSRLYREPDEVFLKPDDPYLKGGLVLHMLREKLGDEVFRRAAGAFIDRFRFACADTDDFRRTLEEASGLSLERFFGQWCRQPGLPSVEVELEWSGAGRELTVRLRQAQDIDADNPAYALEVPIEIEMPTGGTRTVRVSMDGREAKASVRLGDKPARVRVDPRASCAAVITIKKELK